MFKFALISALALLASANPVPSSTINKRATGCDAAKTHSTGWKDVDESSSRQIPTDDGTRYYGIYVPTDYDPLTPIPLIVDYHGHGGSSSGQHDTSQYDQFQPTGFLVVYPQALGDPAAWEGGNYAGNSGADDVDFTLKLISHIEDEYCIDTDRIYASGKSNGGGFVGTLACDERAGVFAAFAMASAALYTDNLGDTARICSPAKGTKTTPIFETHGGGDTQIPYFPEPTPYLGGNLPVIPDWLAKWAGPDRDAAGAPVSDYPNGKYGDRTNHTTFALADGTVAVQGIWVDGMTHCWPAQNRNHDWKQGSNCIAPFDATPLFIDFFNQWDVNGPRSQ